MSYNLAKPTISGILSGLAYQFIKPKSSKEGKGSNRAKRSLAVGLNTAVASYVAENYIWTSLVPIQSFFNMIGSQGLNVFIALFASASQMLVNSYVTASVPRGTLLTNFLYNLGSIVIADQVVSRGLVPAY